MAYKGRVLDHRSVYPLSVCCVAPVPIAIGSYRDVYVRIAIHHSVAAAAHPVPIAIGIPAGKATNAQLMPVNDSSFIQSIFSAKLFVAL